jgi:hypothetical protein
VSGGGGGSGFATGEAGHRRPFLPLSPSLQPLLPPSLTPLFPVHSLSASVPTFGEGAGAWARRVGISRVPAARRRLPPPPTTATPQPHRINLILTILGWIPGVIHALFITFSRKGL